MLYYAVYMTTTETPATLSETALRIADSAVKVQGATAFRSVNYAYAAGVEDALRFMLGSVSGNVFRGFDEAMVTLTEAAR